HRRSAALAACAHPDVRVTAPLRPGLGLLLGHAVVIVVVPGGAVQVAVHGDLVGSPAGAVGAGHRRDHVLVEPLQVRVGAAAAADVLREAPGGVGLRGGQGGEVALGGGVADVDLAAGLVGDGGQAGLDE